MTKLQATIVQQGISHIFTFSERMISVSPQKSYQSPPKTGMTPTSGFVYKATQIYKYSNDKTYMEIKEKITTVIAQLRKKPTQFFGLQAHS